MLGDRGPRARRAPASRRACSRRGSGEPGPAAVGVDRLDLLHESRLASFDGGTQPFSGALGGFRSPLTDFTLHSAHPPEDHVARHGLLLTRCPSPWGEVVLRTGQLNIFSEL